MIPKASVSASVRNSIRIIIIVVIIGIICLMLVVIAKTKALMANGGYNDAPSGMADSQLKSLDGIHDDEDGDGNEDTAEDDDDDAAAVNMFVVASHRCAFSTDVSSNRQSKP